MDWVRLVLASAAMASAPVLAQAQKSGPQGADWASIAQLPDWGGVWAPSNAGLPRPPPPSLTPAAQARNKAFIAAQAQGENLQSQTANCLPPAFPQSMGQPYPIEFLFTPGKVTIAIEAYSQMRRIFTDGRPHPDDPLETFQGHSIGHWEGDVLVVDTVAVAEPYDIAPGTGHDPKMHAVERIHLVAPDRLEIQTTLTDEKTLTAPYTILRRYVRHHDWDIQEYICEQNNHDSADPNGRPGMK